MYLWFLQFVKAFSRASLWGLVFSPKASNNDSDEPVPMGSLVKAFAACTHKEGMCQNLRIKLH